MKKQIKHISYYVGGSLLLLVIAAGYLWWWFVISPPWLKEPSERYAYAQKLHKEGRKYESAWWYYKAAQAGDANAAMEIGMMYLGKAQREGPASPHTFKAVKYFKIAATGGNAEAMAILGNLYATGFGVPQDYEQAIGWGTQAAEKGWPFAVLTMQEVYEKGELGEAKSPAKALYWQQKATHISPEDLKRWAKIQSPTKKFW